MKENRVNIQLAALVLLLLAGLLLWASFTAASRAVNAAYAPYNAKLKEAKLDPLTLQDMTRPHTVHGQMYPKQFWRATGKPCGSDCIGQNAAKAAKVGPIPAPWAVTTGGGLLLAGIVAAALGFGPNPRRNLINLEAGRIRLKTTADTLPIIQRGGAKWGIMRRDDLKGSGRREMGNGIFIGAPGKGKSSLLMSWLLLSDALNFVVIDLKGDLWKATAGHRATLGPVFRLDLSTLTGHALDPFDTDKRADVVGLFEILLPTDEARTAHFNRAAQEIAGAYWGAARAADIPAVPVLVQAATSNTADMLEQARELLEQAPDHRRPELLHAFRGAFGDVWEDADKGSGGERGSVLSSFRAAFAGLQTPEILSTLAARTFDPAELVEGRATLYITAPSTDAPYKAPLEMLLGAVIDKLFAYCDQHGPGEEIVILADEAGALKVPRFNNILATGRSRNVTLTAFLQDLGQLRQYHPDGWRGITDTIHHWTFWNMKNPQARDFLRDACGVYDKRNPSRDQDEQRRRPFVEVNAFDEVFAGWKEADVISLLDYDRVYVLHGPYVTPYKGPAKARMNQTPPQLPRLALPPRLVAPVSQQTPPRPTTAPATRATKPGTPPSGQHQGGNPTSPPAATAPTPTPARQPLPVFDDSDDAETF